jgi:primosomal replication protein N
VLYRKLALHGLLCLLVRVVNGYNGITVGHCYLPFPSVNEHNGQAAAALIAIAAEKKLSGQAANGASNLSVPSLNVAR